MAPQTTQRAIELAEWCLLTAVGVGVIIALVLGMIELIRQAL